MKILGFCNLKGGVGKTTACQNIAAALALLGRKIAVIDMDPQSNLSAGFGITPLPDEPQVFDLLSGDMSWDEVITRKENIDIIPSSLNIVMAELNHDGPISDDTVLREALSNIESDRYDYILLDSPPQLGVFTRNVLTACNNIIVPMDGGYYSLLGLQLLNSSLPVFRERLNPDLAITGILMTNYNARLYIARQIYNEVKENFSDVLFETCINQNVSLIEASRMGMSIFAYSPRSRGAKCYKDAAIELLKRLEGENFSNDESESGVETPDLKQKIIDMINDSQKDMWLSMLGAVSEISCAKLDIDSLKSEFDSADRDRFTFYILTEEGGNLSPVMTNAQINESVKIALKWDENGSAQVYM